MKALFNSKFLSIVLFVTIPSSILFCQKVDTCICEKTIPNGVEKYETTEEEAITRLSCGKTPKKSHFVRIWRLMKGVCFPSTIEYPCDCKAKQEFEAHKDKYTQIITIRGKSKSTDF